jgi:UDP-N-acetylmuramoyl-tripeptide--D-alanyl-D-alanine ligase
MRAISLQQVRQVVGGRALAQLPPVTPAITSICTDTRLLEPGALFIAIRGETHDGHQYLPQAASKGAVAALLQETPPVTLPNVHMLIVPDTRQAMGRLARHVRLQMSARVIAVGGSNGKTGTKFLIDSALNRRLRGSISPKSFNNDIGVPLAIFPADPAQDYLVLELGTNHPGEIRNLTNIALPDIAVITNTSAEHLEGLGSIMGVRQEEASIIDGLGDKGTLIVNGDDPDLLDAVSAYSGRRLTFGLGRHNDLFATDITCTLAGVRFLLNGRREMFVPLLGRHIACNALAAVAVARRMGIREDEIIQSLAAAQGPEMRLQVQRLHGVTLINDAYNANPASMAAALQTLELIEHPGRKIAILGDMKEMGEHADRYHRELGELAGRSGLDLLACIGDKARLIAEEAGRAGMAARAIACFADAPAAAAQLPGCFVPGDLVLLKASRSMRLETIAEAMGQCTHIRRAAS